MMVYLTPGMRLLWCLAVIAALVGPSLQEAGSFYAEMPQQAPRMGRRSQYVPEKKTNRMKYFYAEIPKAMPRIGRRADRAFEQQHLISTLFDGHPIRLSSLLSSLRQSENFDRGGEKCLTLKDLLQIQAFGTLLHDKGDLERRIEFIDENGWSEDKDEDRREPSPSRLNFLPRNYQRNEE